MAAMLSIEFAQERLAKLINPVSSREKVRLSDASGRVSAAPIHAPINLPSFEASAMDGYAVRIEDVVSQGSTTLKVIGESKAGTPFEGVARRGAVRIFTGAAVPRGFDTVVLQEDAHRNDDSVELGAPARVGQHVRGIGSDIAKGDLLLSAGTLLDPYLLGWLSACGLEQVEVTKKPRVALFSTGDELVEPGQPLKHGQIYDSNRFTLAQLLAEKSVHVLDMGKLRDDPAQIRTALRDICKRSDICVTTGGVSVGDADFVRPVVEEIGSLEFWNVALKPGKPLAVGRIGTTLFFGLPGNPISAVITYLLFVAPTIDRLVGLAASQPLTVKAKLTAAVRHSTGRREFQRGICRSSDGRLQANPTGDQGSNRYASLVGANCLIVVPESRGDIDAGEEVDVMLLARDNAHIWQEASNAT